MIMFLTFFNRRIFNVAKFVGKFRRDEDYSNENSFAKEFARSKKKKNETRELRKLKRMQREESEFGGFDDYSNSKYAKY